MKPNLKLIVITGLALFIESSTMRAALVYVYDFPGNPGSGLATDQTNGQPAGATFSDFTRTATLTQMPGAPANNTFGTENWNQTATIDPTEYQGFSITATAGFRLNLTSFTFDAALKPSGPLNCEVGLFLNGSSTAYATFDFSPTATLTTYTFNFTALTDSDNVTSAEFRFFGWNASANGGGIVLDNVATFGGISSVPEVAPLLPVTSIIACSLIQSYRRRTRNSCVHLTLN